MTPSERDELVKISEDLLHKRANNDGRSYDLSHIDLDRVSKSVPGQTIERYLKGALSVMYGLRESDPKTLISGVETDDIITPVRSAKIPHYDNLKEAAHRVTNVGVSVSGSGPAQFYVVNGKDNAYAVRDALQRVTVDKRMVANFYVSPVNNQGARLVE
jgi:homoserine kinase|tara:strand:+ start:168 stop:644 length:477 start_codon:yes stop_codon:yes gene_type:complete